MLHDTSRTDEEIASDVQKGNVESFGALIGRYEEKIARYARKFLSDYEERKDIVQEIFVKVYINIQSFNPTQRFSPWIYRIAHNEFVNVLKKKSRISFISFDAFDSDILLPYPIAKEKTDDRANTAEIRQLLDAELQKIDAKYREVLVLYYFEDMDYAEIADILQIPIATVGVRLSRGKALLKKVEELKELKSA